jgi:hypothetical protein
MEAEAMGMFADAESSLLKRIASKGQHGYTNCYNGQSRPDYGISWHLRPSIWKMKLKITQISQSSNSLASFDAPGPLNLYLRD